MSTLIKICGITSVSDAILSIQAGADYLGLIFIPSSPRAISLKAARGIASIVRGQSILVGVFQNTPLPLIQKYTEEVGLDLIQLHGDESPEVCLKMPRPVIKVITGDGFSTLEALAKYLPIEDYNIHSLLFDLPKTGKGLTRTPLPAGRRAFTPPSPTGQKGAGGMRLLRHSKYFIAGKITSETAADIITRYKPDGIDVASGVESHPGIKDPKKLFDFCQAVRQASIHNKISICTR
jgi:phosphoribosylanthranilate isomerase